MFNAVRYSIRYIFIILILYYGTNIFYGLERIGIPNFEFLYRHNLLIIPVVNYLILLWGIMRPLDRDSFANKKDIKKIFIIFTTLFNIIFFVTQNFNFINILVITTANILEFYFINPEMELKQDNMNDAIKEYVDNHKDEINQNNSFKDKDIKKEVEELVARYNDGKDIK